MTKPSLKMAFPKSWLHWRFWELLIVYPVFHSGFEPHCVAFIPGFEPMDQSCTMILHFVNLDFQSCLTMKRYVPLAGLKYKFSLLARFALSRAVHSVCPYQRTLRLQALNFNGRLVGLQLVVRIAHSGLFSQFVIISAVRALKAISFALLARFACCTGA